MNREPIFTVIIPTYNRECLLGRAINSILSQNFKDFELIIVDDGSTDNTKKLVDKYEDDRIIYIYKENGGHNSARNMGIQNAKGEYIAFCDSDDVWMPEKLQRHIQKYQEDKEVKVVYDLTGIIETINGKQQIVLAREDICEGWCYKDVLEQGYLTSPSFLSCKRECFDKIGMLTMELCNCEDDDLCFRLCKYFKVGLVKEILGIYYCDAINRMSSMKELCANDFLKFWESWSSEVIEICGKASLRKKYFKASYNFFEINEIDTAIDVYQRACKLGDISLDKIRAQVKYEMHANDDIIIYGIGDWGGKIYQLLKMIGFQKFIFVVTNMTEPVNELYGMPVMEIGALDLDVKHNTLIVASIKSYDAMKLTAEKEGFKNIFSSKQVIDMIFDK